MTSVLPRVALALLLLMGAPSLAAHGASPGDGDVALEIADCRFLSPAQAREEARVPLEPERVVALFGVLRGTRIGGMVVSALERFRTQGIGGPERPLRLVEVRREGGPAAEYFENGELAVSASLFEGPAGEGPEARGRVYTAASFVVHETVHAIAHHLFLQGQFPAYSPGTKVNEALAYFVQGLFLDEVREQDPGYMEPDAVPAWDQCTAQIVRILRGYGVGPETGFDEAYDQFAEWQLEADEATALQLAKLWQYFQFIQASGEADALWRLGETGPPKVRVVETLTAMIARDVEQRRCNLDATFAFLRNRIILYAHYPDTPPDTTACQYFGSFVQAVRAEGELPDILRAEIDRWMVRRGLTPAPGGSP